VNGKHTFLSILILCICFGFSGTASGWEDRSQSLGYLQSYTGILQIPTARILPDWSMRMKVGGEAPWTYYGGAAGLFNLVEFYG